MTEAMRLTDLLQTESINTALMAKSKQDAIYELVDLLAQVEGIADPTVLKEAVWQREQTRTTGIGHGIAIPHGKTAGCKRSAMALGRTEQPIEFGAIDNKPVDLIILLASPLDQTGPHIQALAQVSHLLTDDAFRGALRSAPTAQATFDLIAEREAILAATRV